MRAPASASLSLWTADKVLMHDVVLGTSHEQHLAWINLFHSTIFKVYCAPQWETFLIRDPVLTGAGTDIDAFNTSADFKTFANTYDNYLKEPKIVRCYLVAWNGVTAGGSGVPVDPTLAELTNSFNSFFGPDWHAGATPFLDDTPRTDPYTGQRSYNLRVLMKVKLKERSDKWMPCVGECVQQGTGNRNPATVMWRRHPGFVVTKVLRKARMQAYLDNGTLQRPQSFWWLCRWPDFRDGIGSHYVSKQNSTDYMAHSLEYRSLWLR